MSNGEPLYRALFGEDGHLAAANDGGFLGAVLNNDSNILQGQARFFEVDPDDLKNDGGNLGSVLLVAAGIAVGVLATVVVVNTAPTIKTWWLETARPGLESWWQTLTKWNEVGSKVDAPEIATPMAIEPTEISNEIAIVVNDVRVFMSSSEAQQRYLAMMLAVAFAAEQMRLLKGAYIEDPQKLEELMKAAEQLSTQEAADTANRLLEADETLLDRSSQAMFVEIFGGGNKSDGEYLPITRERLEEAMRFTDEDEKAA